MNPKEKRILISADDFGISQLANAKILELTRQGRIDRVEIMISPNLHPEEIKKIKNSGVKMDIHLHLVKFNSDYWWGNRNLKEGAIKRLVTFVFNYVLGRTSAKKVKLEWALQIEKFRDLFGRNPDGIGSHEYIHFFPPYFRIAIELAKEYKISYIRLGKSSNGEENLVAKILSWLRKKNIGIFKKSKLTSSDYMASLDWVENDFKGFIKKLPEGTQTEVVCHPEREEEFEILNNIKRITEN